MKRTKEQISFNMSRVQSKGSQIEKRVLVALRKRKIRFRKIPGIFGKPDFVLADKKIAIFCDSSFWHGYKFLKTPRHRFKTNRKFWVNKIAGNIRRDRLVNRTLRKQGWKVVRLWDFQIKKDTSKCMEKIESLLSRNGHA